MLEMFRNVFGASDDAPKRDASADHWFDVGATMSEINVNVSIKRARQVPVIRSCLKLRAEAVAGLSMGVFQRDGERRVNRSDDHPIARLLENPNRRQTSFDFVSEMVDDLDTDGNFYAEKIFDAFGELVELWRLDPAKCQIEETRERDKILKYTDRWGGQRTLIEDEFWHIAAPPVIDSLRGSSPILDDGKEAVAVAIALQRYSNTLFKNDATPNYAFTMDGTFKDDKAKKAWVAAMTRRLTGKRRWMPFTLENGMKIQRLGLTAEEAQFLETRKELWTDLARIWRVPPHKVGILDKATFSNIEHQSLEFVTDTLRPILELIERSITKFLIPERDHYFEFNVSSLLRGDLRSRYEAYAIGRQWGWLSVNDVLKMEHQNGIGRAGDRYVEPLNMVPVGTDGADRGGDRQEAIQNSIAFLRGSVAQTKRLRLEVIKNAA